MSDYLELTNPRLRAASDTCLAILAGTDLSLDAAERRQKLDAVRGVVATEKQHLQERIALPKIRALEAKLIEGEQRRQIAAE